MPSVKIRHTDGTWRAIGDGKLKVSWGGAWITPSTMKIQWAGAWRDTGYAGYPAEPVNVHVTAWDYDSVNFAWSAGSGGAAVADYHVVQTDVSGGWLRQYTVGGTSSPSIPVSKSTKYRFYVRARSAANLFSDWGPSIGASIGKPAVTTYTTEWTTRPWSNGQGINSYKDVSDGCIVPTDVTLTHVRFVIYANQGFTSILCPYNNRQIYAIHNGGLGGQFNWQATSIDQTFYWDYTGNGQLTGLRCAGTGWSIYSTGLQRALGNVYAYGNERYSYQQAHTTPAVANSYW